MMRASTNIRDHLLSLVLKLSCSVLNDKPICWVIHLHYCRLLQIHSMQYQWVKCDCSNDLTIGCQKLNPLSHPKATLVPQARASSENLNYMTLAPQARQARASGENLNYMTLAPQVRQARPSGEMLNYLLSGWCHILLNDHWPGHSDQGRG